MNTHSVKLDPGRTIWRSLAAIILIIGLAGLPQKTAQAVPLVIVLYVKPIGLTTGACDSWAHACTMQTALANSPVPGTTGNEIWVMEGTYYPDPAKTDRSATFRMKNGVAIYGGFAGTELNRDDRNWQLNTTTLNGEINNTLLNTDNSYHVVTADGTSTSARLDGFTIMDGYANGIGLEAHGGGLISLSGSPSLKNISFVGNRASLDGGGMYSNFSFAMLENVTFSNNRSASGGGMHNYKGGPNLLAVKFNSNKADVKGGGMVNDDSDPVLLEVTFDGNTAPYGGAMHNMFGGTATLTNSTFVKNIAASGEGGGMSNYQSSPVLNNVTFYGNDASTRGGAMENYESVPVLNNVTLSGNTAAIEGGAILNDSSNIIIKNSIIWGNSAPVSAQIHSVSSNPAVTFSDVQGGYTGEGNINSNPLLGDPGTYGSNIQVLPLLPGSPAIDTGQDSSCTPRDARGFTRPLLHHCDMGAYESHGVDLAAVSGFMQSIPILTAFPEPLVISITGYDEEPVDGGKVYLILNTSGPSAVPAEPAATISGGQASMTFTANGIIGSYYIVFYTFGTDDMVGGGFYMTNIANPDLHIIFLPLVIR